ncbi:P-loop containing nucleoside triphosphate hydrolase protein [Hygrophoropsis aurantiaca]|uniref:P-loop containing nucleoside triphosphate hydrolase protein n=1 Tax=Hygrophoropsis aurantiaca TaxID=72124 RepID=A0ACB8AN06_9AGAM|nr:P-loop containing nucleoside triphosphate hydrolase protein [Hygrophoropsis aurantiaca]
MANESTRKKWKGKERKKSDKVMDPRDVSVNDFIIPIMGPTGVGKSTFVNTAAGRDVMTVGHDLKACTAQLHHVVVNHPAHPETRIVFVDTPGFDDTFESDYEILRRISVWLAQSYSDNMKIAGVIYLHEITQKRMYGSTRKNLDMFHELCGHESGKNIVLATSKWGNILEDAGARFENQLKTTFWKDLVEEGSSVERFLGTSESAWAVVDHVVREHQQLIALHIQKELVDLQKLLPETKAGDSLRKSLQEILETHQKTVKELQESKDPARAQERLREAQTKIQVSIDEIKKLQGKPSLGERISQWLCFR